MAPILAPSSTLDMVPICVHQVVDVRILLSTADTILSGSSLPTSSFADEDAEGDFVNASGAMTPMVTMDGSRGSQHCLVEDN